ncbi:6-bladed beta-propeller [uncultured Sphingobacterium sp.]|uniref:6-bladed beta-propeller n=1 Tax=uncultured Sphingobacterium sp. TaxID=182688 RepID=UPI0025CEE16E|nr:6-bladed beta-propeller [uncultured Sphingobacterium sp.]
MKLFLITLLTFSIGSVTGQTKLRIDPNGAEVPTFSELFEEVKFIPLETKKQSIFGSIKQLFVTKDLFIFTETQTNNIMIFYRNGKFKTKIDRDIYSSGSINIDFENERIYYNKGYTSYSFDYEGKPLDIIEDKRIGSRYIVGKNDAVYYDKRVNKVLPDSISHEIFFFKDGVLEAQLFPYNMKNDEFLLEDTYQVMHSFFYTIGNGTQALFTRPYHYTIYNAKSAGVENICQIVLPYELSLNEEELNNSKHYPAGSKSSYFKDHPNHIQSITFPYLMGNNLFFKLQPSGVISDSYLYRLDEERLFRVDQVKTDEKSYYLNVLNILMPSEFVNKNFLVADEEYIYTIMPADALKEQYKNNKSRGLTAEYPEDLLKFLTGRNKNANYVIVALKPKK